MNKTISINLSGIIFNIDENAYEILSDYLSTLKRHFSQTEGRDEIISDIESRIAEIFQTKISDKKQVILIDEVNEVINILGRPENFEKTENENSKESFSDAGDCCRNKRLLRDPDNRVLGGVCSGLGHYFDVDPVWFRLAFVLALFFFGSGTLLYIILWIVIPRANTTAEKLEMKGERVNISNIEKNIKEEIDGLKKRFHEFRRGAKSNVKEEFDDLKNKMHDVKCNATDYYHNRPYKNSAHRVVDLFVEIIGYFVKALVIFVGIILAVVGLAVIIPLVLSLLGFYHGVYIFHPGIHALSLNDMAHLIFENNQQTTLAIFGIIFLVGIPLIMLVFHGIKLIFGLRKRTRIISVTALSLWLVGLLICAYLLISTVNVFSEKTSFKQNVVLTQPKNNTLYIDIKGISDIDDNEVKPNERMEIDNFFMAIKDNSICSFGIPQLKIEKNDSNIFEMYVIKSARGETVKDAKVRTEKINFNLTQKDSLLLIDNCFLLPANEKWRNQNVKIILKVPVGKSVVFCKNADNMTCYDDNVNDILCSGNVNKKITMTENGLKCPDCSNIFRIESRHHHKKIIIED
ncbi:MAG: PspC domain-containing protein [Bacteroidales bacterium]|jgi:phage shock protein PspC (stress-responsive transcriptional regulator)